MKFTILSLTAAMTLATALPAAAASMSADDLAIRLESQARSQKIQPASVRTDDDDNPLSTSGYMAVPAEARIMLDIQFKVGSATVTKSGGKQITALCEAMRSMENMPSLHLIGHTDRSGDWEKNLEISERRAAAVKDYIVTDCELPGGLILTSGEGEAFAPKTGPANNADDRRIEVQLIGMPEPEPMEEKAIDNETSGDADEPSDQS